ncbi:hypothetical protein MCUN1_003905 [Malassezia cuniculi]|uniref:Protein PBN1 n=1 Tax=Malassezia cuniculi TaxID=948313 RepID=A0AAF0F2G1_9BASI|nr:hypothetical protein MCUN1_003905 [Malassezia cuniculi]
MISASGLGYARTLHVDVDVPPHASSCKAYTLIPLSSKVFFDPYGTTGARLLGSVELEAPADFEPTSQSRSWWEIDEDEPVRTGNARTAVLVDAAREIPLHVRYARPTRTAHKDEPERDTVVSDALASVPALEPLAERVDDAIHAVRRVFASHIGHYADVELIEGDAVAFAVCAPGDAVERWSTAQLADLVPRSHAHLVPELSRALGAPSSVYYEKVPGWPTATVPVGDSSLLFSVASCTLVAAVLSAALLLYRVSSAAAR